MKKTSQQPPLFACASDSSTATLVKNWEKKTLISPPIQILWSYSDASKENFQALIWAIPSEDVPSFGCQIDRVPHLAVKYKMKGIKSRIKYTEGPDRYSIGIHMGKMYDVEIFSTASGEFVKVDVFENQKGRQVHLNVELCKVGSENGSGR